MAVSYGEECHFIFTTATQVDIQSNGCREPIPRELSGRSATNPANFVDKNFKEILLEKQKNCFQNINAMNFEIRTL
jgi:hypothetical protein